MSEKKNGLGLKTLILLFVLGTAQGCVYFLPYIRLVFYTPLLGVMQASDPNVTQAAFGSLLSLFAILTMILYIPGGIVTDKWDYKLCITLSLFSTGILVASFGFFMTFAYARIVWVLMAITTTFVFWSAAIKAIRMMGTPENQGKMYGFYYGFNGFMAVALGQVMIYFFNKVAQPQPDGTFINAEGGLRVLMLVNASMLIICGILCQIMLPSRKEMAEKMAAEGGSSSFSFKMLGKALANPLVWLICILVFCGYGIYSNSYFYTVYLTSMKGVSEQVGQQLSLARVTYMICIGSVVGGLVANKLKSTTKWYIVCAAASLLSVIVWVLMMNTGASVTTLCVVSVLPSAFMLLVYGITSSLYQEYGVPAATMGTVVGIVAIFGYMPDLFFQSLLGGFIDKSVKDAVIAAGVDAVDKLDPAVAGAAYAAGFGKIFTFFLIVTAVGLVSSILAMILLTRKRARAVSQAPAA